MLARSKRGIVILTSVLICTGTLVYLAGRYQYRIRAVLWHVQHGAFVNVVRYRVPVPSYWWVEERSPDDAQLWNSKTGESIWFQALPKSPRFTLNGWDAMMRKTVSNAENPVVGKHDLTVAGEPFVCIETDYRVPLPPNVAASARAKVLHLPSVVCMSAGQVQVTFYGGMRAVTRYDFSEFYSLMASVQRTL